MRAALRGLMLAFVYLFVLQSSLSPLATLRMESNASIFGVRCLNAGGDPAADHAAHGACCDAACLLHAQTAAAPPPAAIAAVASPARVAQATRFALSERADAPRLLHGLRPQSQRAPPFA